jgi:apolipoprotein N-acyltransferase
MILDKKNLFFGGFLIGIFWFWWIGYSFIYYELTYLIPFIILSIGLIYGVLFYLGGLFESFIYRVGYFFLLSFVNVLGFNWFKLELPFINSYLGTSKIEFFVILSLSAIFAILIKKSKFKYGVAIYTTGILVLYFINLNSLKELKQSALDIKLVSTNISQDKKWDRGYKNQTINEYLFLIQKAIKEKKDLIIFPETAFAVVLNKEYALQNILLEKSKKISIITGALYKKDQLYYNSTYLFNNNQMKVAHKVVLVPFGEAVPLPEKIRDWINDSFYNGAKDYEVAKFPTTFNIKGEKFRNAICYEATTDDVYKNLDTNFVIATSNNAWFTPSTQPALQRLLLKYYAKKYNLVIYNVTNKSKSGIIHQ